MFDYADPPYIGKADLYADKPTYAGEVDHVALVARLRARYDAGETAGFALSASAESLGALLPLLPKGTLIAAWGKPVPVLPSSIGPQVRWEALLVVGGRPTRPGVPTWLSSPPARGRDVTHVGQKPDAFNAWLFGLLGMVPGDRLADWFPGSGAVTRAWAEVNRRAGQVDAASAARRAAQHDDVADRAAGRF